MSMALWLLLLDSFGFEVTAKAKSTIAEASLTSGTYRAKAQKYGQLCSWNVIQTQLKDIKLLPKLQVLAEFMIEDPVKQDTFKIAS